LATGNSAVNLGDRREADGLTGGLGGAPARAEGAWRGEAACSWLVGGRELNAAAGRPLMRIPNRGQKGAEEMGGEGRGESGRWWCPAKATR